LDVTPNDFNENCPFHSKGNRRTHTHSIHHPMSLGFHLETNLLRFKKLCYNAVTFGNFQIYLRRLENFL